MYRFNGIPAKSPFPFYSFRVNWVYLYYSIFSFYVDCRMIIVNAYITKSNYCSIFNIYWIKTRFSGRPQRIITGNIAQSAFIPFFRILAVLFCNTASGNRIHKVGILMSRRKIITLLA